MSGIRRMIRRGRWLPACVAALLFALPAAASGDANLEDAVITAKVKTAFLLNRQLDSFRINVETVDGVVTLTGLVGDDPLRDLAEEIARTVDGVAGVDNRLRIDRAGEEPPSPEDRTFTQRIRDASIVAAARSALLLRRGVRADLIEVRSQWGIVTLEGRVENEEQRRLVLDTVAGLYDVRGVRDHLDVLPGAAGGDGDGSSGHDVPDLVISSQVRQALALSRRVNSSGIAVGAAAGVVTLSGRVASRAERDEAVRVAAAVWGVNTVVDRLDIGPPSASDS